MRDKWTLCLLGDVITLKRGYDLPQQRRVEGVNPVVSSAGITDYHNKAKVIGPGVVTGRYGTIGSVFFIQQDFWPLNTTLYVKDFKGNDPRFISYFLSTLHFRTQNVAGAVPGVNRNYLHMIRVNIPPLEIQKKFAAILSTYDDLIENNLRRIKILEEMAQNLYREWFVNFRFPGHEHARFVDSPLGNIPEGWEPIPIKDFLTKNIGGSWGKEEISGDYQSKVRVIRGTDFSRIKVGTFDTIPTRYIKQKELNNRMLEAGDLLIENSVNASSRCVGTPQIITQGILKRLEDPTICASFCKLYRPKTDKHTALLYLHMKYLLEESKMNFYQNVAANGIGNFQSQRFLQDEMIIVPSEFAELDKLLCIVKPLLTSIYAEKIDILRQTRDLLLPKLISGEVDVSELDIKAPEEAVS